MKEIRLLNHRNGEWNTLNILRPDGRSHEDRMNTAIEMKGAWWRNFPNMEIRISYEREE